MSRYKQRGVKNHPLFPGKRVADEQRVVMAEKLGRPLKRWEHVHHKDENKHYNDPENLELLPSKVHHQLHHQGAKRPGVSIKLKTLYADPAYRARQKEAAQAFAHRRQLSEEGRQRLRESGRKAGLASKGKPKSPEHRAKIRAAALLREAKKRGEL